MSVYGLLTFCAVYTLAVATPGPGIAAIVARSLTHGFKGAPAFVAGFIVGDLAWFTVAATGLAAVAKTAAGVFVAIKWAGVVYLLYLAWKLWTAPAERIAVTEQDGQHGWRAFVSSLMLTLGNPKAILFFLALLPTVVRLEALTVSGFFAIALVICIVLPLTLGSYVFLAARTRRLFQSTRSIRALNRGAGIAIAGAAVAIATR